MVQAFGIVVCFFIFVFAMPLVALVVLGGDPILTPVPLPQATEVKDDPSASEFDEEDTCPLLLPESSTNAEGSSLSGTDHVPFINVISPGTGEHIARVKADTTEDVHKKVRKARLAQKTWKTTTFAQRAAVLRVLKVYILEEQEDICAISMIDTGKTMLDANLGEILTTLEKLRWVEAEGPKILSPEKRTTGPMTGHKLATVEYEPLGVIAAIAPWNYPFHNLMNPVISSLFAGNAIVVKPSEHTVYSSVYFARIVRRALKICGHSPDLCQVLVGEGDVGKALIESDIDKVFFTGSTGIGKKVSETAAKRLLPTVLELGGKDCFIICEDAEVVHAADTCLRGTFQNAGQNCIGAERIFVHSKVKKQCVDRFIKAARSMRLGVDMGAMTMGKVAIDRIQELVDEAVKDGAKVLAGGKAGVGEGIYDTGFFFQPTILDGVRPDMRIAQEEVFGPVLSIFEWKTDVQLVDMVNDCKFGLGSAIFTNDAKRGDRIMRSIRVGMGNINDFGTNYLCQSMPFGGTKESGSDRFAGIEGLRGCCLTKSITRDRYPMTKTRLPPHFKYPTAKNAFNFCAEINYMMYSRGVVSKFDNLRNIFLMYVFRGWTPRSIGNQ